MTQEEPSVDFQYLDSMLSIAKGNHQFVIDYIQRFLGKGASDLDCILSFRQQHSRIELKEKTHRLISSCSVVGALRMIVICRDISRGAELQELSILESKLDNLEDEFQTVKQLLGDYLTKIMT